MSRSRRMSFSGLVALSWILLLAALSAGCFNQSIHPLYSEDTLVYDTAFEGTWIADGTTWLVEPGGRNSYVVTISGDEESLVTRGRLVQLGEYRFLDLVITELPEGSNELYGFMNLPLHNWLLVEPDGDGLELFFFREPWLRNRLSTMPDPPAFIDRDDRIVFTADTPRLQEFARANAGDREAWERQGTLIRATESSRR